MSRYHPMADLAPRDVVARSIDQEMKTSGDPCAYLDLRHLDRAKVEERFPNLWSQTCARLRHRHGRRAGAGGAGGPLHVRRRGDRPGCPDQSARACTPSARSPARASTAPTVWPATRLLEAVFFAERAAAAIAGHRARFRRATNRPRSPSGTEHAEWSRSTSETMVLEHDWDQVRRVMWDYVGIVRDRERLDIALERLRAIRQTVERLLPRVRR